MVYYRLVHEAPGSRRLISLLNLCSLLDVRRMGGDIQQ